MKDQVTGDDSVICGLCNKETSLATIVVHLANEHDIDIDPDQLANAPIIDLTENKDDR